MRLADGPELGLSRLFNARFETMTADRIRIDIATVKVVESEYVSGLKFSCLIQSEFKSDKAGYHALAAQQRQDISQHRKAAAWCRSLVRHDE